MFLFLKRLSLKTRIIKTLTQIPHPTKPNENLLQSELNYKIAFQQNTLKLILKDSSLTKKEAFKLQHLCQEKLAHLSKQFTVHVEVIGKKIPDINPTPPPKDLHIKNSLNNIDNIIAIASGKGGVGKSTTAAGIACALNSLGFKVGLVDADIYGPSTAFITPSDRPTQMQEGLIIPPTFKGIKIINAAMFSEEGKAHILRGPMAGNLVKQLICQTYWGKLDYLLIDYPPGTGDIQLSISQSITLTAAILVSSPQKLALEDTKKALLMFNTLKVDILGIVETMSYFECDSCHKKHQILGKLGAQTITNQYGIKVLAQLPLSSDITDASDHGRIQDCLDHYLPLAKSLEQQVTKLKLNSTPSLSDFKIKWR
jgi:ATP-binding protein involved in chromosome partitioning